MSYSILTSKLRWNYIRALRKNVVFAVENFQEVRSRELPLQELSSRSPRFWSWMRPHQHLMRILRKSYSKLWTEPWKVVPPSWLPIGWVPLETASSYSSLIMAVLSNQALTTNCALTKNHTSISWRVEWRCEVLINNSYCSKILSTNLNTSALWK